MNARRAGWPSTPREGEVVRRLPFRTWREALAFAIDVPSLTRPRVQITASGFTVAYVPHSAGDIWP